jgi:hypothetical protein
MKISHCLGKIWAEGGGRDRRLALPYLWFHPGNLQPLLFSFPAGSGAQGSPIGFILRWQLGNRGKWLQPFAFATTWFQLLVGKTDYLMGTKQLVEFMNPSVCLRWPAWAVLREHQELLHVLCTGQSLRAFTHLSGAGGWLEKGTNSGYSPRTWGV